MNIFRRLINWFKKTKTPIPFSWHGKKFILVWNGDGWEITMNDINLNNVVFATEDAAINWIRNNIKY